MLTIFSYKITKKHLLMAILLLGAILRFWGLSSAEFYHDEGFTAFRSIGYLDYMNNDDQTTPIQWFKDLPSLPWWTSLSFHDAPPLFFLTQFFSFKLFGNTLFAARLPSALAGIASIYLVYLISISMFRKSDLLNKKLNMGRSDFHIFGLLAALLLSVNLIHIWVSRSSLFESVQIFFILLNIYYFFRFLEDRRRWKLFGLTLGLSFLAKYTSFFLIPVYAVYLAYLTYDSYKSNKSYWSDWRLYAAFGLALLLFTPVIIYNIFLYKTVGHFDLQFAFLFHQPTPEWQASLGKIQDPFSEIISNLSLMYSIPFLILVFLGIVYSVFVILRRSNLPKEVRPPKIEAMAFWLLNIIFITLMLTAVGSAFRFISLYAVPAIMLIAFFIDELISRFNGEIILRILIAGFFVYELSFGFSILWTFPDFGIVTLDKYFDAEFVGRRSLAIPVSSNPHLDKIIENNIAGLPAMDKQILIIHDTNIALSPRLWLFTRRNYYQGIPVLSVDQFKNFLKIGGTEQFNNYLIYFVKAGKNTQLNPAFYTPSGEEFEYFLLSQFNLNPDKIIYGYNNLPMFTVYKFNL